MAGGIPGIAGGIPGIAPIGPGVIPGMPGIAAIMGLGVVRKNPYFSFRGLAKMIGAGPGAGAAAGGAAGQGVVGYSCSHGTGVKAQKALAVLWALLREAA